MYPAAVLTRTRSRRRFRRYSSISSAFRSAQVARPKGILQMFAGSHVGSVSFGSAHGRLGVVLQEKVYPFFKLQLLALANDIENFVVAGMQPFTEFLVRLLPVLGKG